jgi:hypothetical protein
VRCLGDDIGGWAENIPDCCNGFFWHTVVVGGFRSVLETGMTELTKGKIAAFWAYGIPVLILLMFLAEFAVRQ